MKNSVKHQACSNFLLITGRGLGVPPAWLCWRGHRSQGLRAVWRSRGQRAGPGVCQLRDRLWFRDLELSALAGGPGPVREQLRGLQHQHRQQQQQPQERGQESEETEKQQQQRRRGSGDSESGVSRRPRTRVYPSWHVSRVTWPRPQPRVSLESRVRLARPQLGVQSHGQPGGQQDAEHRAVRVSDWDHRLPQWHLCDNIPLCPPWQVAWY